MNRVKSRRLSIVMDGYKRALAIAMIAQQLTPPLSAHAAFEKTGRWVATWHAISWDLQDARGSRVHAGVYTYRLRAGGYEARRKMVVVP